MDAFIFASKMHEIECFPEIYGSDITGFIALPTSTGRVRVVGEETGSIRI